MQKVTNKGFTILELMVALSIIAIMAVYSYSSFSSFLERQKLTAAGDRIFSDLKLAQSESIKRNKPVYVNFKIYSGGWCYGMKVNEQCDCTIEDQCQIDNVTKVVNNDQFDNIELLRAEFAGNAKYTAFDPVKGFAQANGVKNGTIWLESKNETRLAVIVNRIGRVRFCSPTLPEYSNNCPDEP